MKAILIANGKREVVETDGTLESLQKFVDGYIEAAFTVPSPDGRSRMITGYVDEEGLINGKPSQFIGVEVGDFRNVFNGPCIIIGLNDRTGETVGLSDTEVEAVTYDGGLKFFRSFDGTHAVNGVIGVTPKAKKAKATT